MTSFFSKAAVAILAGITVLPCAAQQKPFHIVKTFPVAGDGKWDYIAIDPAGHNLFMAHGTAVNIINKESGAVAGVIENTPGVHGIAFAEKYGKGFTSNGKENMVSVFDIHTYKLLGKIKTGENPDAIMFEPFSKRIVVCNGKSKDLTFINPANNKVTATIALDGKPETAVSDEAGRLYVNLEDKSMIEVVDLKTMKVTASWSLDKGEEPTGLAIDRQHHKLFAGCDNKTLVVVDIKKGKPEQFLEIGEGCDGVAFDAAAGLIFTSNGEGTLTVIGRNEKGTYFVEQTLETQRGAKTLTVDSRSGMVYLPVATLVPLADTKPRIEPGTFKVIVAGR